MELERSRGSRTHVVARFFDFYVAAGGSSAQGVVELWRGLPPEIQGPLWDDFAGLLRAHVEEDPNEPLNT